MRQRLAKAWTRWGGWLMAALFAVTHFRLMALKHASFHTFAFDLGKFDQAIWNTLHGRFLYSTLGGQSILGDHFSPMLALVAPLYWIFDDVRAFFLVQAVALVTAGLLLRKIVEAEHPPLANWFLLAFFLNPALHEVALYEPRRVTLAVPFLAWALYALYSGQRKRMVLALLLALLCKENIGLVVFMVGVYLILFKRDWKWGISVALLGGIWLVVISLWVIPALAKPSPDGTALYPQLGVLCLEGDSYGEILVNVLREPGVLLGRMFDQEAMMALLRIALPVGLALPLLAPDWLLMVVPSLGYMLASCVDSMHRLEYWYMAEVLPGLFAAVAVGLTRLSVRPARWAVVWLLVTTAAGYALFSHAPLGGRYAPELYQVNDHDRLAAQVVDAIPADARVAAQAAYVPHLAHRERIYMFPWLPEEPGQVDYFSFPWLPEEPQGVDYFVLDRQSDPYPVQREEMEALIDDLLVIPQLRVEMEGDGIYLLRHGGAPLPGFPVGVTHDGTLRLDRVEVAELGADGFFHPLGQAPIQVRPGQRLRVSLYWTALHQPGVDWTVSLRIEDAGGVRVVQIDRMPCNGERPTSNWEEGWRVRDAYYLEMPDDLQAGSGSLGVVLYDWTTGQVAPNDAEAHVLHLVDVELRPGP